MHNPFITWAAQTPLFRGLRSSIGKIALALIEAKQGTVVYFQEPVRARMLAYVRQVKKETRLLLLDVEGYQLYAFAAAATKIRGDVAEIGVFRGGSAKIIAKAIEGSGKKIHLYDTFEGLPPVSEHDAPRFSEGQYVASEEEVRAYLGGFEGVEVYAGMFPETAGAIEQSVFSFVNLDVDIYQSTIDSIRFFYPRMSTGGMLVSHDYSTAEGVRKAFDEFFADKPETVLALPGSQCLVVKL